MAERLTNLEPASKGKTVRVANQLQLVIEGKGTIVTEVCKIDNCLYVPELANNLISIGTVMEKGLLWFHDLNENRSIKTAQGKVVLRGRWKERAFQLKVPVVVPNAAENAIIATTFEGWYKRLAQTAGTHTCEADLGARKL